MTLFEEADKKVIIVSPYYQVRQWKKLLNCFSDLRQRDIEIEFYVREDSQEGISELKSLGFNPILIPRLHTKLYINDKYAIVSSMNLCLGSDDNSLDIALRTETDEEYNELIDYYKRYIQIHSQKILPPPTQKQCDVLEANGKKIIYGEQPSVPGTFEAFETFRINSHSVDWSNWKDVVTGHILTKLNHKYGAPYIKDNTLYFKTSSCNFGCYFGTSSKSVFFFIRLDLSEGYTKALKSNLSFIKTQTAIDVLMQTGLHPDMSELLLSFEEEMLSRDFNYVHNQDLPIIVDTISSALYILSFLENVLKHSQRLGRKQAIGWN